MTLPSVEELHRGARFYRTDDEKCTNPRERSLAEDWNKINTSDPLGWSLLDHLLDENEDPTLNFGSNRIVKGCSERDHLIAATVVQWLGSNVGQGFLERATAKADAAYVEWRKKYDERQRAEHLAAQRRASALCRARADGSTF